MATRKTAPKEEPPTLTCSFCGKTQHEVSKLIAGHPRARRKAPYICDECVALCNEIIDKAEWASADTPTKRAEYLARENTRLADRLLVLAMRAREGTPTPE